MFHKVYKVSLISTTPKRLAAFSPDRTSKATNNSAQYTVRNTQYTVHSAQYTVHNPQYTLTLTLSADPLSSALGLHTGRGSIMSM